MLMKSKILKYFSSSKLLVLLFLIFPTAMAVGTFIESWYSTTVAKILIYNAWWFELIMVLFAISFATNIFKYKLLRKEKWSILLIHISLILILVGAFITRYIGYEGVMPIREGETTNNFLSEKTYLTLFVDGEYEGQTIRKKIEKEVLFAEEVNNKLNISDDFKGQNFQIKYVDFKNNVAEGLVLDPEGERYIKIVEAGDGNRHDHYIKEGEVSNIHNILFTLNNPIDGAINIEFLSGEYFISIPFDGNFMRMSDRFTDSFVSEKRKGLSFRSLYSIPNFQFVIPEPVLRGKFEVVEADSDQGQTQDALFLEVNSNGCLSYTSPSPRDS